MCELFVCFMIVYLISVLKVRGKFRIHLQEIHQIYNLSATVGLCRRLKIQNKMKLWIK